MYGYAAQNPATVDGINAAYAKGFEKSPPVNNISHPFSASSIDNIDINDIFHAIEKDFRSGSLSLPLFNKIVSNNNEVLIPETHAAGTDIDNGKLG